MTRVSVESGRRAGRLVRESLLAVLGVLAVAVVVAAIVFGLIVVLYDHSGPSAHAAIAVAPAAF